MRGGGGGGLESFLAKTIGFLTITLKRLYLEPPNLLTFSFYLFDTFWQNFIKIIFTRGGGGGGGEGFLAKTMRFFTITLKRLHLEPPNLLTFSFYQLFDTFRQNFIKIVFTRDGGGGERGGDLAKTIRFLTITLKRLCLAPPNVLTFIFIYSTHFGRILAKSIHWGRGAFGQDNQVIDHNSRKALKRGRGVCCSCF